MSHEWGKKLLTPSGSYVQICSRCNLMRSNLGGTKFWWYKEIIPESMAANGPWFTDDNCSCSQRVMINALK